MTPVDSSNVASIGHDGEHTYVTYKSGGTYRYANVPAEKHAGLAGATSVGKYLHKHFKGQHEATRIEGRVSELERQ